MSRQDTFESQALGEVAHLVEAQVASLAGEYRRQIENWGLSKNSQRLQHLLERELQLLPGIEINRCICFGLGRLTPPEPRWVGDTRENRIAQCKVVMEQLVLMTVVLDALKIVHPILDVFLQDPTFTDVESLFLESLGFTVLQNPEAWRHLTAKTFVYAPYPPNVVVADVFNTCSPALYLGALLTTVRGDDTEAMLGDAMEGSSLSEQARARRLEKFRALSLYEEKAFEKVIPVFDGYQWSQGMCLYWME